MNKKGIISIFIVVVLAAGFFARERIISLFQRDSGSPLPPSSLLPPPSPEPGPVPPDTVITPATPSPRVVQKAPPYTGRNPKEVRPSPEEVKLFNEEQKRSLYAEIENYGDAVKKDPQFFNGWIQGGLLKKVIGDYEGARDMWEYANVLRPQNSVSFGNLGELYWRYLPDFPKAEANFKTSIRNKPEDFSMYISLSDLYFYSYKAKGELADDILLEGISKNKDDMNLTKALAAFYERGGDIAKAIEWWKKAASLEPQNAQIAAAIKALEAKMK